MSTDYELVAQELEAMVPQAAIASGTAEAAIFGGWFGDIIALAQALRSGDIEAAKAAALRLLNVLLAPSKPETITLMAPNALFGGGKFDFRKLLELLLKILPLIANV